MTHTRVNLHGMAKVGSLMALIGAVLLTVSCGGANCTLASSQKQGDPLHLGADPGPLGSTTPSAIQIRLGSEPNDRIVSLSLTLNSLQATNSGGGNIDLLPDPMTIEFAHQAIVTVPISATNIYDDTYSALVFPEMTGEAVFYNSNGNPVFQNVDVPAQSVPANFVLGQNPMVLNVFLDLSQSFTITDPAGSAVHRRRNRFSPSMPSGGQSTLFVNPLVLAVEADAPNPAVGQPESGDVGPMFGIVTAVDTQNQIISVQPRAGDAMQFSYSTAGSTIFQNCDPTTLTGNLAKPEALTQMGNLVELEGVTQTDGSLLATEMRCIDPTQFSELYGQLNGYAPEGTYYNLILDAGDGANVTPSLMGTNITVDWTLEPEYQVDSGNLDLSGSQDLIFDESHAFPGQLVEMENDTLTVPDPDSSNTGYFEPLMLKLEQQTLTGVVSGYNYDPQSQTGSFTLVMSADTPLGDMNPGLTAVTVRQIPQTYLRKLSSITEGSAVKVRGFLFVDPNCSNAMLEADPTMPVDFIVVASRISQ